MKHVLRALLFLLPVWLSAAAAETRTISGVIDGAPWSALVPAEWNGKLWIEAHGLREPATPLIADLYKGAPLPRLLLKHHWVVATTSYRRNGLVLADAMDDLIALRAHLATVLSEPKLTVVEGSSMGGAIVTHLAERATPGFDGYVAAGAALEVQDPRAPELALVHAPRRPLLFLTNQSEFDGPRNYVERARASAAAKAVPPALWKIHRDGHVNVNAAERFAALEAVMRWVETGAAPADRDDATAPSDPGPSTVVRHADGSLTARVIELSRVYGNLTLDLQPRDLEKLGVAPGGRFVLRTEKGSFDVLFGKSYNDVPRGGWVAFVTGENQIMIARNFANAAERAEVDLGSAVTIDRAR